jgi:hypothetical protein
MLREESDYKVESSDPISPIFGGVDSLFNPLPGCPSKKKFFPG